MSSSKMDISEKLIDGYVKDPPSFQEQAITKLAIHLCQHIELKNCIILPTEHLQMHKYRIEKESWDKSIEKISINLCRRLSLPPALKNRLIARIWSIALQLFSWNMQQVRLGLSPLFADSLLTVSDWTVEMRLNEKKIAKRLVRDKRIPVCQRFKMACTQCLRSFIYSLWDEISTDDREHLLHYKESNLVQLWSYKLARKVEDFIPRKNLFRYTLLLYGIGKGSRSTVFLCWSKLGVRLRQLILTGVAKKAVRKIYKIGCICYLYTDGVLATPVPHLDILCFLLTQMCKEERVLFFQEFFQVDADFNILSCFLQWPYLDLLLPIIKEVWNILPEEKFLDLLLSIAHKYSDDCSYRNGYLDYDYGDLMIELLNETPHYLKRYIFGANYYSDKNTGKTDLLNAMIRKKITKFRNIRIFEHIWQHVTLDEKQSFLRSKYGESFCCFLAHRKHWGLLNSILRKYLHEDEISMLKKQILRSESGKDLYFKMLMKGNKSHLDSWLNWGFQSKQDIFKFILKKRFRDHSFESGEFSGFGIDINCLDNVLEKYSPSEDARRKARSRLVKIYSRDVCIHFIKNSKWKKLAKFLNCGFLSKGARIRFKKRFGREYGIELCEYHLDCLQLKDAERFLSWCFPSEEAAEQFKQELFFFSGVYIQWRLLNHSFSNDFDIIMKFFKLSPEAILKFKKEVLLRSYSLSFLFDDLTIPHYVKYREYSDYVRQGVAVFLRWGLADEETLMAFKEASNIYLRDFSVDMDEEVRQLVQQNWDKLINERLSELSIEHEIQVRNEESLKQEIIFSLKMQNEE